MYAFYNIPPCAAPYHLLAIVRSQPGSLIVERPCNAVFAMSLHSRRAAPRCITNVQLIFRAGGELKGGYESFIELLCFVAARCFGYRSQCKAARVTGRRNGTIEVSGDVDPTVADRLLASAEAQSGQRNRIEVATMLFAKSLCDTGFSKDSSAFP